MERIDKKRQIVISDDERRELYHQFEEMFVKVDHEAPEGMYSGENIKLRFPKVWELYCLIVLTA